MVKLSTSLPPGYLKIPINKSIEAFEQLFD